MGNVFIQALRENQDIIKVNKNKMIRHVSQNIIDQSLKCCRGIGKTKGHDTVFKMSKVSVESGFPFVTLFTLDQVVAFRRFNLINTLASCRGPKAESISGSGHLFLTVMLLRSLKSMQGRRDSSFF